MTKRSEAQPPHAAVWLLDLLTPPDEVEPMMGDLLEEFSGLAARAGTWRARRWYWAQTRKTVAHALGRQFQEAPSWTGITALAGLVAIFYASKAIDLLVAIFLEHYRIYPYISAPTFALIHKTVVEGILCPIAIGWTVAAFSRRREMAVTLLLALIDILPSIPMWYWIMTGPHRWPTLSVVRWLPWMALTPVAILLGGILRRKLVPPEQRTGLAA